MSLLLTCYIILISCPEPAFPPFLGLLCSSEAEPILCGLMGYILVLYAKEEFNKGKLLLSGYRLKAWN